MSAPRQLRGLDTAAVRAALLRWYRRERRDLPWRRSADPYRIWLSEVMLQQTTVAAVVPYYERFVARYPDLPALAAAREEDVLALWSGLGYYRRAHSLLAGARAVVERHGGRFPREREAALALPGIGPYTAAAVLSIALGQPEAVVDGNVRRVLARLLAIDGAGGPAPALAQALATALLEPTAPGDWNQAVMELGATVCTPKTPDCGACPLHGHCRALRRGLVDRLPAVKPRRASVDVVVAAAIVRRGQRCLLVRRGEGPLLAGFWELPQTSLQDSGLPDLVETVRREHGVVLEPGELIATARHAITFRRIRVEAYVARAVGSLPRDPRRLCFASAEEAAALPVGALSRKLLSKLS
jgi:A/G-specific adenine glycosylase